LERGRQAFEQRGWGTAYAALSELAADGVLDASDLERLAAAAYLTGRDEEAVAAWTRAHQLLVDVDDAAGAVRCAFWVAFALLNRGDVAPAGGWIDRASRLLESGVPDCIERGYLRYVDALRRVLLGDVYGAFAGFREAAQIAEAFRGPELTAMARIGVGRCLIYSGDVAGGVALLDEAMVSVGAHEVSAIAMGDAYCTVIEACGELFDIRRTQAWTAALSEWCDTQPELVLYRGQCLLHRAEVLQLRGDWSEAMAEIDKACA